jgi:hypothetical protein
VNGKKEHDRNADELMTAYKNHTNTRVPIRFVTDEQVWLLQTGQTFKDFYKNPTIHLAVQLAGQKWERDSIVADQPKSYPDVWRVSPRLWMHENEFFGCKVVYQQDDYAWAQQLEKSKQDILDSIQDIDPLETVRRSDIYKLYINCREIGQNMQFENRPIEVLLPGMGTDGIFTKACEIRGVQQFCEDLFDDSDFADRFLDIITQKTIQRIKAWHTLIFGECRLPYPNFGIADDSLTLISVETYRRFILLRHERLYSAMTNGMRMMHLCGHSEQHYHCLHKELRIMRIDGPGTFVDHGRYLDELGEEFSLEAQMDNIVLKNGTPSQVEEMMQGLLTSRAKKPGRFQILGFINRGTPKANIQAAYEAGLKYGKIGCEKAK